MSVSQDLEGKTSANDAAGQVEHDQIRLDYYTGCHLGKLNMIMPKTQQQEATSLPAQVVGEMSP